MLIAASSGWRSFGKGSWRGSFHHVGSRRRGYILYFE
jgi:hypothetical protein